MTMKMAKPRSKSKAKAKSKALESEIRLGGGPEVPSGFVSLDELADNIRAISTATKKMLETGPLNRRAIELLMDAMPSPNYKEKKIGIKTLRTVLDKLAELEDLYVIGDSDE